jgi:hypothetical protein
MTENNTNDGILRRRVGKYLSNPNAKFPFSLNFYQIRMLTYLFANTGESIVSLEALDGHKKWYWVTVNNCYNNNTVTKLYLGHNLNNASDTWRLSPKIGNMRGLNHLSLWKCSFIPSEIADLVSLKRLDLCYCDDQIIIDLPQVEMPALNTLCIDHATWDATQVTSILSWLSVYAPKLTTFRLSMVSRDTAKLFITALLEPDISNRMNNLRKLRIQDCGLFEVDIKTIIFDLLPLYPNIVSLNFYKNKIESLQNIGIEMATKMKNSNSNSNSSSELRTICLAGNPCFTYLKTTLSSDHSVVISLLKYFKRLRWLGHTKEESIRPTSEIEYWTKINRGGRFLVDGGGGGSNDADSDGGGKMLPLNLWPKVLERSYRTSIGAAPYTITHDATAMFYLIREGPLFSEERSLSTTKRSNSSTSTCNTKQN